MEELHDQGRPSKRRKLSPSPHLDTLPSSPFFSSPLAVPATTLNSERTRAKPIRVSHAFRTIKVLNLNSYSYAHAPPKTLVLLEDFGDSIPGIIYRPPHYSRTSDIPERPQEYAGLSHHFRGGQGICGLEDWGDSSGLKSTAFRPSDIDPAEVGGWEYASGPPSMKEVNSWLASENGKALESVKNRSRSQVGPVLFNQAATLKCLYQIEGPTQANIYGLKNTLGTTTSDAPRVRQPMALLSLEVFGECWIAGSSNHLSNCPCSRYTRRTSSRSSYRQDSGGVLHLQRF
jgi:DNA polymerase zeta